ncbi:hypothetical protein K503DRAFT_800600 [Rhizopogon vinicolor AM-OR11-026]|uniref:F-box domain-containing protein n=1 Tax=Rhizopogon vinicolor AM-OR11-026 TaxID=1314800 RepID=A0A1B7N086_9AGAM|nr:hypothetical protein K503DRAFT_800600 [Rhizopogon vinicolor AM-OR11-026]
MSNDEEHPKPNSNQDNIPPVLKLPPEVLDYCWGYLRRPDLFQLSRVCRVFWGTSRFRIFQLLAISLSSPPMLLFNQKLVLRSAKKSSQTLEHAITRLTSFYSDPGARELWDMVQAWTVAVAPGAFFLVPLEKHEQSITPRYVDTVFQFLPCSRNLRSLELARLDLGKEQWITLQSLPALETLRLVSCFFSPSSYLEPLKLKELEIAGCSFNSRPIDGYLVSVLCNPAYLEKLTLIDPVVTHTVLAALSSVEHFPHLTYLSVLVKSSSRYHFFRFLAAIPSLTILNISPSSGDITPAQPLPALSFLRSYNGYPHLLSHIVPGRPIDRVCLVLLVVTISKEDDDYAFHTDLVSHVLDISRSAVPVRRLKLEYFLPTLQHFSTIAKYLPDLHCLDLVLILFPPQLIPEDLITSKLEKLDCASNPLDVLDTMGIVLSWLAAGRASLPPKLQTLRLSYSPGWSDHAPSLEGILQRVIIYCLHDMYLLDALFRDIAVLYCRRTKSSNKKSQKPHSHQDNGPPILRLPPDVLNHCWSYLRQSDLFQVSRVCRVFWHTSRLRIFQSLAINLSSSPILPLDQKSVPRSTNQKHNTLELATSRVNSFYSDPDARELWDMVEAWSVTAAYSALSTFFPTRLQKHDQKQSADAVFQFLSCSRNLRSLELARLDLGREQWVTLQSLPALETLKLTSCFFSASSHLEPLKLKELEIAGGNFSPRSFDGYLVSVLCNPAYLEKLTLIDSLVTPTALTALSSMEHFPHLTYLSVLVSPSSRGHFLRFLAAIPSLVTLRIFPWSADITPDHPLPAMSYLRSYNGYPHFLSHVVPGRPVDRVCLVLLEVTTSKEDGQTDDYTIHTDLVSNLLDISRSTVPVSSLKIEYFQPTLQHLAVIAKYLPDLYYLDLVLISAPPPLIPEDLIISSNFEDLDCASSPLDALDTIWGLLSWLAAGRASLPPKLQTLRLSCSPGWSNDVPSVERIQQFEIIHCLRDRYPSLCEVRMGDCRWWREAGHWSLEILDVEDI